MLMQLWMPYVISPCQVHMDLHQLHHVLRPQECASFSMQTLSALHNCITSFLHSPQAAGFFHHAAPAWLHASDCYSDVWDRVLTGSAVFGRSMGS